MVRSVGIACISGIALFAADAARAQQADTPPPSSTTQAPRTTSYDAAFFAQYAPRNALDIARQVPGFTLELGDTDTRGFAGAAGNVVINGSRPSSKAESLETVLARIPANRVVRVQIGPGDLYGAEYSGKSQVLNVILSADAGFDGNVTVAARRLYTGDIVPNMSASALIKRGQSTFNVAAGTERFDQVEEGTDTRTDPETGELREFRRKINSYYDRAPFVSGSWALEKASDWAIRLNGRYSPGSFYLTQSNRVFPVGGADRRDRLVQDFKTPVFEVGGDMTQPLAGGALKLVGLATRRKRDNAETYLFRTPELEIFGGSEQTQEAKQGETLARLTWSRSDLMGFSFETGAEAVLNTLDSNVELFEFEAGGAPTRIDLPIDQAVVKERRAEAFFNIGRNLSPALRLDGGLTYEFSDLTVTGDTSAERTLKFLKPNLAVDWKPGGGWHAQMSIRRTVAQLDFFDFISVAELSNDRVNAGNANLQPQRAWELRATVDKKILGDGLIKLDAGYDHISMLQDRILIFDDKGKGFDAPGNLGTGKRAFARLTLDAPLDGFGIKGTRLKANGQIQRTRVEDPISGEQRNFSDFFPDWEWEVELRRDAGKFSYGATVEDRDRFTFFRTNEFDTNWNAGPYGTAFVEYRPTGRTTLTFDVDNLFDTRANRERIIFDPNRTNPEPSINELRERNRHRSFRLTIKQSFGGGGAAPAGGSAN